MATKILGISGSPKPAGNTFQSLKETLNYARENLGVETEIVNLARMKIAECNGCYRCVTEENVEKGCPAFDDDMIPLYPKVASADAFLFATPTYFGTVTGLMKIFLDRLLPRFSDAHCVPDRLNHGGITLNLVQILGFENERFRCRICLQDEPLVERRQSSFVLLFHRIQLGHRVRGLLLHLIFQTLSPKFPHAWLPES